MSRLLAAESATVEGVRRRVILVTMVIGAASILATTARAATMTPSGYRSSLNGLCARNAARGNVYQKQFLQAQKTHNADLYWSSFGHIVGLMDIDLVTIRATQSLRLFSRQCGLPSRHSIRDISSSGPSSATPQPATKAKRSATLEA